jgi:hypothetical protein
LQFARFEVASTGSILLEPMRHRNRYASL